MKTSTFFHASRDPLTIKTRVNSLGNIEVNLEGVEADLNFYLSREQSLELMQSLSSTLMDSDPELNADIERLEAAERETAEAAILRGFTNSKADAIAVRANETRALRCDCGGPADGTGHAPDCSFVLDGDQVESEYRDAVAELEIERDEALAAIGRRVPNEPVTEYDGKVLPHDPDVRIVENPEALAARNRLNADGSDAALADEGTVPGLNTEL